MHGIQASGTTPCRPAAPTQEEREAQRSRLADLLGRLLARYWLRTATRSDLPDEPVRPPGPGSLTRRPRGAVNSCNDPAWSTAANPCT
jgi:hypothetical protein